MSKLSEIERLCLSDNNIRSLPESLKFCKNLSEVCIYQNLDIRFSRSLSELEPLTYLIFTINQAMVWTNDIPHHGIGIHRNLIGRDVVRTFLSLQSEVME